MRIVLALMAALVAAGACLPCGGEPLRGHASFDLNEVVNPDIIGAGVNFAFSDYVYIFFDTGEEWTDIRSQHLPYPGDARGWGRFMEMMDFAGFQYVRFCVGLTQWEPMNDNDDPHALNLEEGFVFSPGFEDAHPDMRANNAIHLRLMHRLLDHWERRGLYVVLGNWAAGPETFCPDEENWLVGDPEVHAERTGLGVTDLEEFTEGLAAIMYHLKAQKGYDCVKGISVYNEPEHFSNYFETLAAIYNSLDAQLRRAGVRDETLIQAFDGALFWNREMGRVEDGVARLLKMAGPGVDIISKHDYNSAFEYLKGQPMSGAHGTIRDFMLAQVVEPALAQIEAAGRDIPLVVGEMGTFLLTSDELDEPLYAQRLHNAEETVELFNNGVKAVAYWIYNNNYHRHWRMLTFAEDDPRRFTPESVNYYPLALTMKYIQRGSDIVRSEVEGLTDERGLPRVFVTAAVKGDDLTLLWVNDAEASAEVTLSGLPEGRRFRKRFVTSEDYEGIALGGETALSEGAVITLPPRSITVYTTYAYGGATPRGVE